MRQFPSLILAFAALAMAETQVVLLGTGTPNADPARSGPSTAIVVNGSSYVVDLGPGVVRRAAAAKVAALAPAKLRIAFLTHLHSDHTAGLSDFYLTPAVLDRHGPLLLFGPRGTKRMARHIEMAYKDDVENRVQGLERGDRSSYRIDVREFRAGKVYEDGNVTVKAIPVQHGDWSESYGFVFETRDGKRIVVSGDTVASENIERACNGCDVLVHEVYAEAGWRKREPQWQRYHKAAHTSGPDLGRLAHRAQPKKLVLTHLLLWTASMEQLLEEIRAGFSGAIHAGQDLDVIPVP
jgi:ribonuclease BN (tRNA processing enzyme)